MRIKTHHQWTVVSAAVWVCMLGPVQAQTGGWSVTGSPTASRDAGQRAVLLADGKVLLVGGAASSELYDPATGLWTVTGSLAQRRSRAALVRLANGKVLAVGGGDTSAEVYDPETGAWSATGNLSTGRVTPTGVLLGDGRVLIAGGSGLSASAEVYDPVSGTWSSAGTMTEVRSGGSIRSEAKWLTSTLLPDGRVLVVGGDNNNGAVHNAEIYDPATGSWTATDHMISPRFNHTATLLPNGKVLIAGGTRAFGQTCPALEEAGKFAELFDPATGQWSATGSMTTPRASHIATLLSNGKVLVTGVADSSSCLGLVSSELYDPATGTWSATSRPSRASIPLQAVQLTNGKVLAIGGNGTGAELFDSGSAGVVNVSSASFVVEVALAPESIATAFWAGLEAGISVKVRDRMGVERLAPLFYVGPGQINYQVPAGTAVGGLATVTVSGNGGVIGSGFVEIAGVAPGLFSFDPGGTRLAAAQVVRVKGDGTQVFESVGAPIDLGPASEQVFLILYGTGIRFRSGLSAVSVSIGGVRSEVLYAGAASGFAGLDQVNVLLPRALAGRGDVEVTLTVDGKNSNSVRVNAR